MIVDVSVVKKKKNNVRLVIYFNVKCNISLMSDVQRRLFAFTWVTTVVVTWVRWNACVTQCLFFLCTMLCVTRCQYFVAALVVSMTGRDKGKYAFICGTYDYAADVRDRPVYKHRKVAPFFLLKQYLLWTHTVIVVVFPCISLFIYCVAPLLYLLQRVVTLSPLFWH